MGRWISCHIYGAWNRSFLHEKFVLDFVKKTEAEWDDKLYSPVSKRTYLFTFLLGIQLTMNWVLGTDIAL